MAAIKENVSKDGKIISYRVRACVGRDGAGKQVWRSVTISIEQVEDEALKQGFERLTPARQKKIINRLADAWETAEKEQFMRTPSARDKGRVTVKDFIEKTWIPIYVEDGKKSPNSVKFFKNTSKPIIDFMGSKRMNQVDAELCSRFVTYLNTVERERGGGPLSQTSRMHIFGTLRNILRTARRWKYIQTDPTEDMTRGERPSREKKPVAFLTESEAQQFLDALQEEPLKWRAYFTLLLMTGMRRGEAVALQWSDIDDGKDTGAPTIECGHGQESADRSADQTDQNRGDPCGADLGGNAADAAGAEAGNGTQYGNHAEAVGVCLLRRSQPIPLHVSDVAHAPDGSDREAVRAEEVQRARAAAHICNACAAGEGRSENRGSNHGPRGYRDTI